MFLRFVVLKYSTNTIVYSTIKKFLFVHYLWYYNKLLIITYNYDTIWIAHIFSKIFTITFSLSKYFQTSGIDLIKFQQLIKAVLTQLEMKNGMEDKNKQVMNLLGGRIIK